MVEFYLWAIVIHQKYLILLWFVAKYCNLMYASKSCQFKEVVIGTGFDCS